MRRILLTLAACSLATCALVAAPARAQDDDAPSLDDIPHITALGTASATVAPDVARITVGVTTQEPTASEAAKENTAAARRLVEAAKAAGVAPSDLTTTSITLFEINTNLRQPDGSSRPERQGFKATAVFAIDVRDFSRVGPLTQTMIEGGANQFSGVGFRVEHPEATLDQLTVAAMRDARHQAGLLAGAAGVKVGRLLQVERPDQPAGAQPFARGDLDVPVASGTRTLSRAVEATYAIEP